MNWDRADEVIKRRAQRLERPLAALPSEARRICIHRGLAENRWLSTKGVNQRLGLHFLMNSTQESLTAPGIPPTFMPFPRPLAAE